MTKRICIFLAGAAAVFAQSQTGWISSAWRPVTGHATIEGQTGPVVGKPIEAIEARHNEQVLSDGTKLANSSSSKFYRDSQGRMRTESPERVEIYDPVAAVTYDIDPRQKTFTKTSTDANTVMIAVDGGWSRVSRTSGTPRPERPSHVDLGIPYHDEKRAATVKEDLPPQVINGIAARGSRVTTTIPAGAVDNDREFKIQSERWYSDDLQVLLKTTSTDPRFGTSTYELTNIQQTQPDSSLFQPPAGYTERADHHF